MVQLSFENLSWSCVQHKMKLKMLQSILLYKYVLPETCGQKATTSHSTSLCFSSFSWCCETVTFSWLTSQRAQNVYSVLTIKWHTEQTVWPVASGKALLVMFFFCPRELLSVTQHVNTRNMEVAHLNGMQPLSALVITPMLLSALTCQRSLTGWKHYNAIFKSIWKQERNVKKNS